MTWVDCKIDLQWVRIPSKYKNQTGMYFSFFFAQHYKYSIFDLNQVRIPQKKIFFGLKFLFFILNIFTKFFILKNTIFTNFHTHSKIKNKTSLKIPLENLEKPHYFSKYEWELLQYPLCILNTHLNFSNLQKEHAKNFEENRYSIL